MRGVAAWLVMSTWLLLSQARANELITVAAVGDVMMASTHPVPRLPEQGGRGLFDPALPWLAKADIRLANFEGTFFDGEVQPDGKRPGRNRHLFKTPTSMVGVLADAGFNVVSLANNHARDFGRRGLDSTRQTLARAGIAFADKDSEVPVLRVGQAEVAVLAADYYAPPRSITQPEGLLAEVRQLSAAGKLVIVTVHAGGEGPGAEFMPAGDEIYLGENRGNAIAFARAAIDAGADLVLMHGPHVPRGLELYRERLVAYSLGNFMTGPGISVAGKGGWAPLLLVQMDAQGRFVAGRIVSFVQQRGPQRLELDPQAQAQGLMVQMSQRQFPQSPLRFEADGSFR